MKGVRGIALLLVLAGATAGCKENPEARYPTAALAASAGAFERGWLPKVLQPDATDIYETHDIDSNSGYGTFAMNPRLLQRLESSCERANSSEFRCEGFQVLIDASKGRGRFRLKG